MTTKKIPADIAAFKGLIQEQALKIATLEKERDSLKTQVDSQASAVNYHSERANKAESVISQAHDLMDACPAALPRMTIKKQQWSADQEVEQSLIVRMGSWLGATRAAA